MANAYRFVKLLKNHIYPTYQLHAFMANDKLPPQDGLRLAALTTMEWLKYRLGEAAPSEWESIPSPEAYLTATDDDLPSIYVNQGHVINIVSLPEKGMWTLQITEPDLGSDPGNPNQKRPPVPGRIIETNIAFQVVGKELECGFKTVISDPTGMAPEAEVYRTMVVRKLMENPTFGLKQVTDIPMKPIRLTNNAQVKTMLWLTSHADNQLPTVIFTQPLEERKVAEEVPDFSRKKMVVLSQQPKFDTTGLNLQGSNPLSKVPGLSKPDSRKLAAPSAPKKSAQSVDASFMRTQFSLPGTFPAMAATQLDIPAPKTETVAVEPAYDLDKFSYYTFSHCRTYVLEHAANKALTDQSGIRFQPGDIIVIYPTSLGGGERVIPYRAPESPWDESIHAIEKGVKDYLKEQTIDFGHIMFLSGVREHLLHATDELLESAELADAHFKTEIEQLNAFWKTEIARKDHDLEQAYTQLQRQKEYAAKLEGEKTQLREEFSLERDSLKDEISTHLATIEFLRRRYDQPHDYDGIEVWVKEHFSDRLFLHPRAVSRMMTKSCQCASVDLICDALDYLATDYWEMRYLQIPKDVALTRCGEKYGRPFDVKPTGQITIKYAPGEYRI